jgi:hypothetical protein
MFRAVPYALSGAIAVEIIAWGMLIPWASTHFTTGFGPASDLWKPLLAFAVIGGLLGLVVFAVLRLLRSATHR